MFSTQIMNTIRDATMFGALFYILSNPKMYSITGPVLPKLIKDRTFLHAIVFMVAYIIIQIITKRV